MTIFCSRDSEIDRKQWKLAFTHILFEAALFMNMVVMIVYWTCLHEQIISDFKGLEVVHMYIVHSFPATAFLINYLVTDVVLYDGH